MKTWASRSKVASLVTLAALIATVFAFAAFKETDKYFHSAKQPKTAAVAQAQTNSRWNAAYANLPLRFEENQGQSVQDVRFVSRGAGYQLFLTSQEAVLALHHTGPHDLSPRHRAKTLRALAKSRHAVATTALRMRFEGANPAAQIVGEDQLPGQVNYFVGDNPKKWHSNVPTYSRVKYSSIYPGVDLVYYGNQRHLEYDLIVAPGANPQSVVLNLQGAQNLHVTANGDLAVRMADGEVQLQKPLVYQNINGQKKLIAASYALAGNHRVKFAVADYDRQQPLVLDPVLNYSTYLGGTNDEIAWAIAVDSNNNAVVAGNTFSTDFPVTAANVSAEPETSNTFGEIFVTQLNSTGTAELYSTYLSGSSDQGDYAFGVAVDSSNMIYVTGQTFSTDFPTTTGAFKLSLPSNPSGSSYVTKIDPTKSGIASLAYSSYIGGNSGDFGDAVAAGAGGNVFVSGVSFSSPTASPFSTVTNFPVTANAFQNTLNTADGNAYLTRIDTTQSGNASLIYSSYLGGSGDNAGNPNSTGTGEEAFGVAVDSTNNAYLVGTTTSLDFPVTTGAYKTTAPAAIANGVVFFSKINTAASGTASLVYSTYLGGTNTNAGDFGSGIAIGPNNVAYLVGSSSSVDFPTTSGAYLSTGNTIGLAFISLIDPSATGAAQLKYSTLLGGTAGTLGASIKADSLGNAYVTGGTGSSDFPTTAGSFQQTLTAGAPGAAFIAKLNPASTGAADLLYSTFFGGAGSGAGSDQAFGIAIDSATPANAYIAGQVYSPASSFPVSAGAYQTALSGTSDAFVAKLSLVPTFGVSVTSLDFGNQVISTSSAAKTVTLTNNTDTAVNFTSAVSSSPLYAVTTTCGATIPAEVGATPGTCTISVIFTPIVLGPANATLTITDGDASSPQTVNLTGTGVAVSTLTITPTSLDFSNQTINTASAAQTVTLTNSAPTVIAFTSAVSSNSVFAATTSCGASIPAQVGSTAGTCTISVVFTPTATGAATGTLTITDADSSSPTTVTLTGNGTSGGDFAVTAPGTASVTQGASTTFTATVTPSGGFNQAIALTCTGAPAEATCTIAPPSVTAADGTTAQTATVTVTTTAPHSTTFTVPPSVFRHIPPTTYILRIVPFFLAFLMFLLFRSTQNMRARFITVAAMLVFVVVGGCSTTDHTGGGSGGSTGGTPMGTATLTITGTSGSLTHTATVTLTVN